MREVLITSSVLIASLLLLRLFFRHTISRRAQYALWALVLLRLLVPVNLSAGRFSVLNLSPSAPGVVAERMAQPVYVFPLGRTDAAEYPGAEKVQGGERVPNAESFGYSVLSADRQTVTKYAQYLTVGELFTRIWAAGAAVMAGFFLLANFRFARRLRRGREPFPVEGAGRRVYLCETISSPCLFGILRPAIYLTPAAVGSPERIRHVMAHEETHARHLDGLWSFLRCVCLAVYWFNPLVWAAAWASRADCELACDEGALLRLGEDERIPYGRTLLSLIPVRRFPPNPLLSATTMAAGKRQLRDRIRRIAQRRKTAAAALFTAVVLALAVCACTFTGTKKAEKRPLTGEELRYFSQEYFNAPDGALGVNLHNYFITSLYDAPEEIDLFELFYLGLPDETGVLRCPGEEECLLAFETSADALPCPGYKLTTADMDAFLKEHTGLALDQTGKKGLDRFTYLPKYDAYYWLHGDTNYRALPVLAGEREGELVSLYYDARGQGLSGTGYACLTLRETEGGYQFVSNQSAEKPAVGTVLPEGKPDFTVSLSGIAPYEAPAVAVERHTDDCAELLDGWMANNFLIRTYRATDGGIYAAVIRDESAGRWVADAFLTLPDSESGWISAFSGLFGHDGLVISYPGEMDAHHYSTISDYYYLTASGVPVLLARAYDSAEILDLNGDGTDELVSPTQLFFFREGRVYLAELPALLAGAMPEMKSWVSAALDQYSRAITVRGLTVLPGADTAFQRQLYFDGENLLAYEPPT